MATIVTPPSSIKVQVGNQQGGAVTTINQTTNVDSTAREIATSSFVQANSAFNKANSANTLAQSAYNAANTKVSKSGDTMTGSLTLSGEGIDLKFSSGSSLVGNEANNLISIKANANNDITGVSAYEYDGGVVQLYSNNRVEIITDTSASGALWTFNKNGSFTFPNGTIQTTAFTGYATDNTARITANAAYNAANAAGSSANVVAAFIQANAAFIQANASFLQANTPSYVANSAGVYANGAFAQANSANTLAQAAYNAANAAGSSANVVAAFLQANSAYDKANSANVLAKAAFDNSNTKFSSSGGTITGSITVNQDATIQGNLYIMGNTTSINTSSFTVQDSMLILGLGNYTTDALDIGFASHYNAGVNAHTGLIRDSDTKEWMFFEGYTPEVTPNNNIIITDPSFRYANVTANNYKGNVIANNITINGYNVFTYITNAYTQANNEPIGTAAFTRANASFLQANSANTLAANSYIQANSANTLAANSYIQANASFIQANSANTLAANSYIQANASFIQANNANTLAANSFIQANSANVLAANSYIQANAAFIMANAAFAKANTGGSGSSSGYQNNSVIFANTNGYLSNTSNLQYYSSNNTLAVTGNVNVSNTFVAFYNPAYTNWLQVTGSNTGNAVIFSAVGGDSNVSMLLQTQGTGAIDLSVGSKGVNISNGSSITAITRTAGGSGFTGAIVATISPPTTPGSVQATALASTSALTYGIASAGTGYTLNDVLTVLGGTNTTPLTLTVTGVSGGGVTSVTVANYGGYTVLPTNPVSVSGGTGSGVTFNLSNFTLTSPFTITNAGSGYVEQPTITFGPGGTGAGAYVTVGNNTTIKNLGNITTFATPGSSVLAIVDKNANAGNPTNSGVAFSMVAQQSNFGASYLGFGADAYFGTTGTSATAFQFATSVTSPVSNGAGGVRQFAIAHTSTAVNSIQVTGGATGTGPTFSAQGSDTNADLNLAAKNTGKVVLAYNSGQSGLGFANATSVIASYTYYNQGSNSMDTVFA